MQHGSTRSSPSLHVTELGPVRPVRSRWEADETMSIPTSAVEVLRGPTSSTAWATDGIPSCSWRRRIRYPAFVAARKSGSAPNICIISHGKPHCYCSCSRSGISHLHGAAPAATCPGLSARIVNKPVVTSQSNVLKDPPPYDGGLRYITGALSVRG